MSDLRLPAIDAHAHYGVYDSGSNATLADKLMSGTAAEVARRARMVDIRWTVVSPLMAMMPRGHGNAFAGNLEAAEVVAQTPGMLQYVVIDPRDNRTFAQANELLQQPKCVGIKIHPEEHCYPIKEYGYRIFEFAAARRAVVLTHSSESRSLAADFVPFADAFPEVRLILAHIGCGCDGDLTHQVRAIQQSKQGNMFADTSSASSITPGLIEWSAQEIGAERVLFGTDTPLYYAPMQRARIDYAELSDADKLSILYNNAWKLFDLDHVLADIDH